jgi:hypothetical protein
MKPPFPLHDARLKFWRDSLTTQNEALYLFLVAVTREKGCWQIVRTPLKGILLHGKTI